MEKLLPTGSAKSCMSRWSVGGWVLYGSGWGPSQNDVQDGMVSLWTRGARVQAGVTWEMDAGVTCEVRAMYTAG